MPLKLLALGKIFINFYPTLMTKKPQTIEVKRNEDGTISCPNCGKQMWGCEYDYSSGYHYDGISEWICPKKGPEGEDLKGCGLRVGRWSSKVLTGKMMEKPYGGA